MPLRDHLTMQPRAAGSPSTVHVSIFDVRVSVADSASLVVIGNFPVGLIVPRVGTFAFFARA